MKFRKGDKVKMTSGALENYGKNYRNRTFTIIRCANKYMPASIFFKNGKPEGYHPGYDNTLKGTGLYDLRGLKFSLYDWELERA